MHARRAACVALGALALTGCGGGGESTRAAPPPALPPATVPDPSPPPSGPPVGRAAYVDALDAYCRSTVRAAGRLADAPEDDADPIGALAAFARGYRVALERLGALTPPAQLRRLHLLTVAQARESADRVEDGVRLGRQGDIDAATTALEELEGLLPGTLPAGVRRDAPACS